MTEEEEEAATDAPTDGEQADVEDTIFRNLYNTSILPPWQDEIAPQKAKDRRSRRDYTIAFTDENAADYGDVTRLGWKGRVDYALREMEEERKRSLACVNDVFRDPNHLLEVTISTIILMASGSTTVPMENYLYTELYLKNIKDENGFHPPNISKLLKHMRYLKKQYDIKWEEEFKVEPPPNLVVAKICKKSRIPVKINRSMNTSARAAANESNVAAEEPAAEPAAEPAPEPAPEPPPEEE